MSNASITTPVRTGPSVNRGRSKQDYGTPWEFIHAVEKRFGPIVWDLAAHAGNAKHANFYSTVENTLIQPWAKAHPTGNLWLNPEFSDIAPYAQKCALESASRHGFIFLLTPASIGTDWFASHVNRKALVLGLSPRMTFEGTTDPYPKDLSLSVFGYGLHGFDTWRWK
jgi:phage N-6-adenine-methyltransferase